MKNTRPMELLARRSGLALCISVTIFVTAPAAVAQQATGRSMPNEFLGIRLGGIYQFSKDDRHNLPVAMVTGVEDNFGSGGSFYFKPTVEEPSMKYLEYRVNPRLKHFLASHRAYLLPMFPATLRSKDELDSLQEWDVEALHLEWTALEDGGTSDTNYIWAVETCKTYSLQFGFEPTVAARSTYTEKQYRCNFADGEREFSVFGGKGKRVTLKFADSIINEKHKALARLVDRLKTPGSSDASK
jgi:hypothetical protein